MFCKNLSNNGCKLNCKSGLQAIPKKHKNLLKFKKPENIKGSINLDQELKKLYPNDNRWDYLVAYIWPNSHNIITFFEVHDLSSLKQINVIIKKKKFVFHWLKKDKNCSQGLDAFSTEKFFYCIPTRGVNRKVAIALSEEGIKIHKKAI